MVISFFFFVYISLTADGSQRARLLPILPTATLPSCLWSLRIFPSLSGFRLQIAIAMQVQHSYTSSSNCCILLAHVLPFSATEAIDLVLSRIEQ